MNMQPGSENSVMATDLSSGANRERQMKRQKEQHDRQMADELQRKAAKLTEKARRLPLGSNGRKKKEAQASGMLAHAAALLRPQLDEARQRMAQQGEQLTMKPAKPAKPAIFR